MARPLVATMSQIKIITFFSLLLALFACDRPMKNMSAKGYERQLANRDKVLAIIYEANGKQGLKDTLGNIILPAKYDYIQEWLQYGVALTDLGGRDASGHDYVHYEMDKIGLVDYKGNILFEPQFETVIFNGNPIALVKKDRKFGYINNKGQYEIDLIFEDARPFQNGFAVVKPQSGYGLINTEYEYVIEPQLDSLQLWYATGFSKDTMLLIFNHQDSTKMINNQGEIFDVLSKSSN